MCGTETFISLNELRRGHLCNKCGINKKENTNIEKYGSKSVFGSKIIREKSRQTMLQKYGVEHCQQNLEIKEKTRATCLEKYG